MTIGKAREDTLVCTVVRVLLAGLDILGSDEEEISDCSRSCAYPGSENTNEDVEIESVETQNNCKCDRR